MTAAQAASVDDAPGDAGEHSRFTSGLWIVFYIAAAKLLLHLLVASRYGYFGDELYFLACSEHLDWGYVDQPPMIALTTWFSRHVTGESLLSLRSLSALSGAGTVIITGLMAREFGARRLGMALAALSAACGGVYFVLNYLMTMNCFEPLIWTGCAYVVIRIVKTGNHKLWLWFGLMAGIGLQTKYSISIFGFGIVVGLLLTPERRAFASKWIWIAGALAFLIFLPNFIWNIQHHWPFVELMRNIKASGRDVQLNAVQFILQQMFMMNPLTVPVWVGGLFYFLFHNEGKRLRVLGWAFLVTTAVLIVLHGKVYFLAPAYPMLFAGGGALFENILTRRRWLLAAYATVLLAFTEIVLPLLVPVLPVEALLRYQEKLPFKLPATEESHRFASLPHHFAWQFGWEEMTAAVARVYFNLPPGERAKTGIIGNNFAESGAIDFFGPKYGLPKSIGVHQNYWLWGPRNYTGELLIVLGDRPADLQRHCEQVEIGAELNHPYASPGENRPVLICRGLKANLREVWPRLKDWN